MQVDYSNAHYRLQRHQCTRAGTSSRGKQKICCCFGLRRQLPTRPERAPVGWRRVVEGMRKFVTGRRARAHCGYYSVDDAIW